MYILNRIGGVANSFVIVILSREKMATEVVVHQLKRGKFTPCVSPFALKLETYLRMAGISYRVNKLANFISSKTHFPSYSERFQTPDGTQRENAVDFVGRPQNRRFPTLSRIAGRQIPQRFQFAFVIWAEINRQIFSNYGRRPSLLVWRN